MFYVLFLKRLFLFPSIFIFKLKWHLHQIFSTALNFPGSLVCNHSLWAKLSCEWQMWASHRHAQRSSACHRFPSCKHPFLSYPSDISLASSIFLQTEGWGGWISLSPFFWGAPGDAISRWHCWPAHIWPTTFSLPSWHIPGSISSFHTDSLLSCQMLYWVCLARSC